MNRFSRLLVSLTLLVIALSLSAQQTQPSPPQAAPRSVAPSPDLSVDQLEEEGDALRAQKNFLDAMDYYRAALKKSSTAALHNKAGVCWIQMAHYSDARKEFEQALKLDNGFPEAHNNLGLSYYQMKHYSGAAKEYNKTIKLRNTSATFHTNLAPP